MKHRKVKTGILLLMGLYLENGYAQQGVAAAGGNADSPSGTVSYSAGQVMYLTTFSGTGSVAQGVQQPFEISVVLGNEQFASMQLAFSAYPNPTTASLKLFTGSYPVASLSYQLSDLNGRVLNSQKVSTPETTILVEQLPAAIYLLKVVENGKNLKTFKIIKH